MTGSLVTATLKNKGDIAFHFNPRFDDGSVIRNSRQNQIWGPEERTGGLPFRQGNDFEIMFLADHGSFKVAVNGTHFIEFIHRMPLSLTGVLNIGGEVIIKKIEFRREIRYQQASMPFPPTHYSSPYSAQYYPSHNTVPSYPPHNSVPSYPPHNSVPSYPPHSSVPTFPPYSSVPTFPPHSSVPTFPSYNSVPSYPQPSAPQAVNIPQAVNPPIPYRQPLPNGIYNGMMIFISGKPSARPYRFTVNFCVGMSPDPKDIAFHFNPRFDGHHTVCNSMRNNNWEKEERHSNFPFTPGTNFDMSIRIEANRYLIAVNGQHYCEFYHRFQPLSSINMLEVTGDLSVSSVRFA